MSAQAYKRLNKEYRQIQANPPPFIIARPSEANILDWHYVITGPPGTPYEGGQYHGRITFPSEYPFKPPRIKMSTPSGRFEVNQRLCLSMSDFHEESWNPSWSVSTIITGLLSFMTGNEGTTGSIVTSLSTKKQLAKKSKTFNTYSNPAFKDVFPDIYEQNLKDLSDEKANEIKKKTESQAINNTTTKELPTTIDKIEDPEDRIRAQSMKTIEIEDKEKSFAKNLKKLSTNDQSKNSSTIIVITIAVIFGILLKSMGLC